MSVELSSENENSDVAARTSNVQKWNDGVAEHNFVAFSSKERARSPHMHGVRTTARPLQDPLTRA